MHGKSPLAIDKNGAPPPDAFLADAWGLVSAQLHKKDIRLQIDRTIDFLYTP